MDEEECVGLLVVDDTVKTPVQFNTLFFFKRDPALFNDEIRLVV